MIILQVGIKTTAERGEGITVEVCVSADGGSIPPLFIIPRIKINEKYMKECPSNSIFGFNKSGWMTNDLFKEWFDHFIKFAHPTLNNRILLLLDGNSTYVKNIDVIERLEMLESIYSVSFLTLRIDYNH